MPLAPVRSNFRLCASLFLLVLVTLPAVEVATRPPEVLVEKSLHSHVGTTAEGGRLSPGVPAGGPDAAVAGTPGAGGRRRQLSSLFSRLPVRGGEEREEAGRSFRFPWQHRDRPAEDLRRFAKSIRMSIGLPFLEYRHFSEEHDPEIVFPHFGSHDDLGYRAVKHFVARIRQNSLFDTSSERQPDPLDAILPEGQARKVSWALPSPAGALRRLGAVQAGSWYIVEDETGVHEMRVFTASKRTPDLSELGKLEREVKDLAKILFRVHVSLPRFLEESFHWHVPLDLASVPGFGRLVDAGQDTAIVNTLLIFTRRHGTITDIERDMKEAARSGRDRRQGLAALLSVTAQLIKLIAIYNSRGFFLRTVTPENFVLTDSGVVLLTRFSPLLEGGNTYYETDTGDVVSVAPSRTARGFRPDAHANGAQLAGILFALWCEGPAGGFGGAAYPEPDFSACIPGMPPAVPSLIESLLGARGHPRLTALEALESQSYRRLVTEQRALEDGDPAALHCGDDWDCRP